MTPSRHARNHWWWPNGWKSRLRAFPGLKWGQGTDTSRSHVDADTDHDQDTDHDMDSESTCTEQADDQDEGHDTCQG